MVTCPGHHESNAVGLIKHSDECLHPASVSVHVQCSSGLEAALSIHIHQGTAPGFWMNVNLKILKTVSKNLGNKADNLVLNSDESGSALPSAWAVFRNYLKAQATPSFTYCTSSRKNRGSRWLHGWSSTMIGLAQNTYSWMIMSTLTHQS